MRKTTRAYVIVDDKSLMERVYYRTPGDRYYSTEQSLEDPDKFYPLGELKKSNTNKGLLRILKKIFDAQENNKNTPPTKRQQK